MPGAHHPILSERGQEEKQNPRLRQPLPGSGEERGARCFSLKGYLVLNGTVSLDLSGDDLFGGVGRGSGENQAGVFLEDYRISVYRRLMGADPVCVTQADLANRGLREFEPASKRLCVFRCQIYILPAAEEGKWKENEACGAEAGAIEGYARNQGENAGWGKARPRERK